jgi:predicted transposase YbfD/YdcC
VRSHWGIENGWHWILDMAFREDECRVRAGHAAHNFAILRHTALNLLRHETSLRCGVKAKRMRAGRDTAYLLKIVASI